jgi:hypothetical protein
METQRHRAAGSCVVCKKNTHGKSGEDLVCFSCYQDGLYKQYLDRQHNHEIATKFVKDNYA